MAKAASDIECSVADISMIMVADDVPSHVGLGTFISLCGIPMLWFSFPCAFIIGYPSEDWPSLPEMMFRFILSPLLLTYGIFVHLFCGLFCAPPPLFAYYTLWWASKSLWGQSNKFINKQLEEDIRATLIPMIKRSPVDVRLSFVGFNISPKLLQDLIHLSRESSKLKALLIMSPSHIMQTSEVQKLLAGTHLDYLEFRSNRFSGPGLRLLQAKPVVGLTENQNVAPPSRTSLVMDSLATSTTRSKWKHDVFMSYSRQDSMIETTMIQTIISQLLPQLRIFRDNDQHFKLDELVSNVQQSGNALVFLSPHYFSSPYCMVEMIQAINKNVNIVTIVVEKPGMDKFDFDADHLKILTQPRAVNLLKEYGIDETLIRRSILSILNVKAFVVHADSPRRIIEAEIGEICKGLKIKDEY
jgi:hypothetical protein